MNRMMNLVTTNLMFLALLLIPQTIWAQNNDESGEEGFTRLEEVVVYARRREEQLQDYAGAASVFGKELLQQIRLDGLEDIVQRLPNANFEQRTGSAMNIWIRGAGTSTSGSATNLDTGVALYYDDFYSYIQGSRVPLVFYDMDSVQVYRGPQGSLYGRNAVGGAVAAFTASPSDEFETFASLEYGEHSWTRFEGRLNIPVNDTTAFRVSGYYNHNDNFYNNINPGVAEPDADIAGLRLRARFTPSDALDIVLGYEYLDEDTEAQTLVPADYFFAGQEDVTQDTTPTGVDRRTDRFTARISYELASGMVLRSNTGYFQMDGFTGASLSNLPSLPASIMVFLQGTDFDRSSFTQEFLLLSGPDSPFEWLVGAGYYRDEESNDSFQTVNANTTTGITSSLDADYYALFFDLNFHLTDNWTLGLSGRYSDETRDGRSSSALLQDPSGGGNIPRPEFPYHVTYSRFSPTGTLSYRWNDQVMAYAKIATSYQAGGVNTRFISEETAVFGPSPAISYEVGLRTNSADDRWVANVSLFKVIQDDYQYRQNLPPANPFQNVGEATIDGAELELMFQPADWIRIPISYGYMDARITDGENAFYPGGGGITGQPLRSIPKHTFNVGVDIYKELSASNAFYLRADYNAVRDRYEPFFVLATADDYDIVNVRLGLRHAGAYDFYLFGQNLTDERYIIFETLGAFGISPPRVVGVGFTYSH